MSETRRQFNIPLLCISSMALVLSTLICGCSPGATGAGPFQRGMTDHRMGSKQAMRSYNASIPVSGINNFHVVEPYLLRGAHPTTAGLKYLKAAGVRTVIDLRIAPKSVHKERMEVEQLGMHSVNLAMGDQPPTSKQVASFLSIVQDPTQQPVYVHCEHGADRAGEMVGIFREKVEGWPFDKTYKEMLRYGFKPYYTKLRDGVRSYAPRNR